MPRAGLWRWRVTMCCAPIDLAVTSCGMLLHTVMGAPPPHCTTHPPSQPAPVSASPTPLLYRYTLASHALVMDSQYAIPGVCPPFRPLMQVDQWELYACLSAYDQGLGTRLSCWSMVSWVSEQLILTGQACTCPLPSELMVASQRRCWRMLLSALLPGLHGMG
jgi:hypothetical protein